MRNKLAVLSLAALGAAAVFAPLPAHAGGALESVDITNAPPSPIPGRLTAKLVPIFWDARCMPVPYKMNNTLSPIPNPFGPSVLSLAQAKTAFQQSFNAWNQIPTSYINMQIVGETANPGFADFDMVNELSFRAPANFGAIAVSPSTNLIADSNLANGTDIDGDGDSDVSSAIATCGDADGDGDFELPAGFYKAGTILDNDVIFDSGVLRFTVNDAEADTNPLSVDLRAVATHEFGHSHGLSHVLNNNKSKTDGNAATMFPFIDTADPVAELAQRSLDSDDIAWSSYFYPEGSAASGAAAIQLGDIPFKFVYGLIKGSVTHGVWNEPVAGASVSATDLLTGQLFTTGFSGNTQVEYNPLTGGLSILSPAQNIVDGNYVLPVRLGLWNIGVEATDGLPVPSSSISLTAQIGDIFGQLDFNEELWNGNQEAAIEVSPGFSLPVASVPSLNTNNVNFITNDQYRFANYGERDFVGFTGAPPGRYYAVQFPAGQLTGINGGDFYIQAGTFETFPSDASTVPLFAEAILTTGTVTGGVATLDLAKPLARQKMFLGQDTDESVLYFSLPKVLGDLVQNKIATGEIQNLFLALRLPTTPPSGASGLPITIGLDGGVTPNDAPIFGLSFISDDGGATFNRVNNFNFRFSLLVTPEP